MSSIADQIVEEKGVVGIFADGQAEFLVSHVVWLTVLPSQIVINKLVRVHPIPLVCGLRLSQIDAVCLSYRLPNG